MSGFIQHDPWLDNTSLDTLLSLSPSVNFDFGSRGSAFTGLQTPPDEEPGDFIQRLANQVRSSNLSMRTETHHSTEPSFGVSSLVGRIPSACAHSAAK